MRTNNDSLETLIVEMLKSRTRPKLSITSEQYDEDIKKVALIDGADAYEFFIEYKSTFNVDMTHFVFLDYFSKEGMWPWEVFLSFLGKTKKSSSISIRQLADIARAGKWPEELSMK